MGETKISDLVETGKLEKLLLDGAYRPPDLPNDFEFETLTADFEPPPTKIITIWSYLFEDYNDKSVSLRQWRAKRAKRQETADFDKVKPFSKTYFDWLKEYKEIPPRGKTTVPEKYQKLRELSDCFDKCMFKKEEKDLQKKRAEDAFKKRILSFYQQLDIYAKDVELKPADISEGNYRFSKRQIRHLAKTLSELSSVIENSLQSGGGLANEEDMYWLRYAKGLNKLSSYKSMKAGFAKTWQENHQRSIDACIYEGGSQSAASLLYSLDDAVHQLFVEPYPKDSPGNTLKPEMAAILIEAEGRKLPEGEEKKPSAAEGKTKALTKNEPENKTYLMVDGVLGNWLDFVRPKEKSESLNEYMYSSIIKFAYEKYIKEGKTINLFFNGSHACQQREPLEFVKYVAQRLGKSYYFNFDKKEGRYSVVRQEKSCSTYWMKKKGSNLEARIEEISKRDGMRGGRYLREHYFHSWHEQNGTAFGKPEGNVWGFELSAEEIKKEYEKFFLLKKNEKRSFLHGEWHSHMGAFLYGTLVAVGLFVLLRHQSQETLVKKIWEWTIDLNGDEKEDLLQYEDDSGTWRIKFTKEPLPDEGYPENWDWVIREGVGEACKDGRPRPSNYNLDRYVDLAVACRDGSWLIDYGGPRQEDYGQIDKTYLPPLWTKTP